LREKHKEKPEIPVVKGLYFLPCDAAPAYWHFIICHGACSFIVRLCDGWGTILIVLP
jgi:hypothetical protein